MARIEDKDKEKESRGDDYPVLETNEAVNVVATELTLASFNWKEIEARCQTLTDIDTESPNSFAGRLLEIHVRMVLEKLAQTGKIELGVLDNVKPTEESPLLYVRTKDGGLVIAPLIGNTIAELDADFLAGSTFGVIEAKFVGENSAKSSNAGTVRGAMKPRSVSRWATPIMQTAQANPTLGIRGLASLVVTIPEAVDPDPTVGMTQKRYQDAGGIIIGVSIGRDEFLEKSEGIHMRLLLSRLQNRFPGQGRRNPPSA